MGTIVAIGGGELKDLETLQIDKQIVKLTKKKHPIALFVPTASSDVEEYWKSFQKVYGEKLGCKTIVLSLIKEKLTRKQIQQKIFSADLIYVGGGNTLRLVRVWRKFGVDKMLKLAYKKGIVLSGLSAGAICWFAKGFSDSVNGRKGNFGFVNGLGLINEVCCPHYNNKKRAIVFNKAMQKIGAKGIGIEDNVAIVFKNHKLQIIRSNNRTN